MEIIKIKISHYDKETPELQETFKKLGLQEFDSLSIQFNKIPEGYYEIDTKHIFSNQYNTTCGLRVFEKCSKLSGRYLKPSEGYYISEGIEKIRVYQKRVKKCHYCGKQYLDSKLKWCTECRDSKYLTPDNYHLLKLTNIREKYAPENIVIPKTVLKDIEKKNRKRLKKRLLNKLKYLQENIDAAKLEYKVFDWLIKNKVNNNLINNCIYYNHTDKFCFGWRNPLQEKEKIEIEKLIKIWPFSSGIEYKA